MDSTEITVTQDTSITEDIPFIQEARVWQGEGWTARVINNDDDDGWAVAMFKDGEAEAALVGPWTMGRDKKNPKPLDNNAFLTLVKTAHKLVRGHEQQLHASLHQSLDVNSPQGRITVRFDIVPDDEHPYAVLSAHDEMGECLAEKRVQTSFKFNRSSALAWVEGGF